MAAINVVLNGTFTVNDQTAPGTFQGTMAYADRGVGGGPIEPPLGIWGGGNVPMPTPPIANVPGAPGYRPPDIDAHPEHPIVLPPDPPIDPPTEPPTNPPSPQWVWGFNPTLNRWLRVYVPGEGQAGPKTA